MSSALSLVTSAASCSGCYRRHWRHRMHSRQISPYIMKLHMKLFVVLSVVVAGLVSVEAQQRLGRRQAPAPQGSGAAAPEEPGIAPAEIQRLFDAYALVQAQEQLTISDDQYAQFLTRFKAL